MNRDAQALLTTARALAADAACVEVTNALRKGGIEPILLKGPTTANWLYGDEARGYSDTDLLIAPHLTPGAATVLSELGFEPVSHHVSLHAHPWVRANDGAIIDLHVRLWGPNRPAAAVWQELQAWVEPHRMGPAQLRILNLPARALHIALHAAQHREQPAQPAEDLRRALTSASLEVWRDAERLAARLWALPAMADGLILEPKGRDLVQRLPRAHACLLASQIVNARGPNAKASALRRLLTNRSSDRWSDGAPPSTPLRRASESAQRWWRLTRRAPRVIVSMRRVRTRDPDLG